MVTTQLSATETDGGRPGRPRSEQAERAIIEATLDLLAEVGVAGTSIEQIAARAGVGKATIYRRWPNKEALVVDAAAALKGPLPVLPGTSVRDDLLAAAEAVRTRDLDSRIGRISMCFFGEGTRHPELALRYFERAVEPRRELIRQVLRRGMASGELRDDLDIDVMVALVTSPVIHQAMTLKSRGEELSREFTEQLIDAALDGLRGPFPDEGHLESNLLGEGALPSRGFEAAAPSVGRAPTRT